MDKKEARAWLETIASTGVATHPNVVRRLAKLAEIPLPGHLKESLNPKTLPSEAERREREHKLLEGLEKAVARMLFEPVLPNAPMAGLKAFLNKDVATHDNA